LGLQSVLAEKAEGKKKRPISSYAMALMVIDGAQKKASWIAAGINKSTHFNQINCGRLR
jgi:hypothetical protein